MEKIKLVMDMSDFDRPLGGLNLETTDNNLRVKSLLGHWSIGRFENPLILNEKLQTLWNDLLKMHELLGFHKVTFQNLGELFTNNFFKSIDEPTWIVLEIHQRQSDGSLNPENWYIVDLQELILSFNQAIGFTPESIMNLFGIDPKSLKEDQN